MIGKNVKRIIPIAVSVIVTIIGFACAVMRLSGSDMSAPIDIAAAEMTMPIGDRQYSEEPETAEGAGAESRKAEQSKENEAIPVNAEVSGKKENQSAMSVPSDFEASEVKEGEIEEYDSEHEGEEKYPVDEFTITEGNTSYNGVQVKNTSSTVIDIKSELEGELGFEMEDTDQPQVLIYHTHTSESYLTYDTGYFYESFFPRTTDISENVCAVGEEIAKQLNSKGIVTIHDTTLHDYPSYSGAYDRSLETINSYLEKYPTIKVVLDIHRDGIGSDTEKHKPVFTAGGRKGAQVMILSGYNYDDCEEFEDWEYNLRFALKIQEKASQLYPEMMRPVNFSDFMYNMNVNTGSLLIEVGSESNTLEEARYAGCLLGKVLCEVLKK